jgi:hypothetical protein
MSRVCVNTEVNLTEELEQVYQTETQDTQINLNFQ